MSQPRKPDISAFFIPHARQLVPPQIPQKRATPEYEDEDTIVVRTPSSTHIRDVRSVSNSQRTPKRSSLSSLTTPRSGRSVSIPIRSPSGTTPKTVRSINRSALFNVDNGSSQTTPKATPSFSFADAPTSSRKVIEDGKLIAVRDSDESDNESLESLTDIFDRKPGQSSSSQAKSAAKQEDERLRLLSMYTGGQSGPIVNRDKMRALQRKQRETKIDVSSILDDDLREEESRARILKMEAELEESTRELEESKQSELDKKMLAAILQGDAEEADPDELARLMSAVDRTEALSGEKLFSFFVHNGPHDLSKTRRSKRGFPSSAIPGALWQPKDISSRNRMYVSGIMGNLAAKGKLSDEALRWTFDSILHETNEELSHAYLNCITSASSKWTRTNVTPEDVQDIFLALGGEQSAIRDNAAIELKRGFGITDSKQDHGSLLKALSLFDAICNDMDFATLSKLTSLLCRMCLDDRVMGHNQTMHASESLLQRLTNIVDLSSQRHVHERIMSDLTTNLKEPVLQAQFLSRFTPTSLSGAKLRTSLAAVFLLGSSKATKLLKPHSHKQPLTTILRHVVTSSKFHMTPETNYQDLTAYTLLLDTTISSGHSSFLNSDEEERIFNTQVDDLAETIHGLFTSIADSGASHMRRTEAKDALQALHNRLLFAVRMKKRRKKHIFDSTKEVSGKGRLKEVGEVRQEVHGQNFMQRFLKKQDKKVEEEQEFVDVLDLET